MNIDKDLLEHGYCTIQEIQNKISFGEVVLIKETEKEWDKSECYIFLGYKNGSLILTKNDLIKSESINLIRIPYIDYDILTLEDYEDSILNETIKQYIQLSEKFSCDFCPAYIRGECPEQYNINNKTQCFDKIQETLLDELEKNY